VIQNTTKLNAAVTTGSSPSGPLADLLGLHRDPVLAALETATAVRAARPAPPAPAAPPRPSQLARRGSGDKVRVTFEVYAEFAPALRSAIEEISNDIGARLTGSHRFAKEQALTDAAVALAALRVAVFAAVPEGDPNYV
jgi:hypothetical protein